MADSLTLYTIGHSNLAKEEFLAHLQQHEIRVLVDIRSHPASRFMPHFNKKALDAYLKENGIHYHFAGDSLGGRPKDETVYKSQPPTEARLQRSDYARIVDYEAVMQTGWYQAGIKELLQIVADTAGGYVAVMCSEGQPHDCHRHHLVTRSLLDPAVKITDTIITVKHIDRDGCVIDATPEDFAPPQPRLL
ncbi:MAG: DUF488 domain-containing protein [Anaerolineaceae bacterium]|nr:DUF488 domain-containing protein [Anaerolineaceae bacterium]